MQPATTPYHQLAAKGFGVGVHWTTWTVAQELGKTKPFPQAVTDFDTDRFADTVASTGARHLLFTVNHELHFLPCPSAATDRRALGRTCTRDLPLDLIRSCERVGLDFLLYYHHGCDAPTQDPTWQNAVGGHDPDGHRLYQTIIDVTSELGRRYGTALKGWWFDAGWSLTHRHNPPWSDLARAARDGHPDRVICFNQGIDKTEPVTLDQDFYPGEAEGFDIIPESPIAPGGLPWYSFTTWHIHPGQPAAWGIDRTALNVWRRTPPPQAIARYYQAFRNVGGTVTFNLPVYQDGALLPADLAALTSAHSRVASLRDVGAAR
jgi:hypothetical protein